MAVWPVDPDGGGTWIGANEHGVVLAVLNLNSAVPAPNASAAPRSWTSRGLLIPAVAHLKGIDAIARAMFAQDLKPFRPFRLLVISPEAGVCALRWDGEAIERAETIGPACFVSSGLGDQLVLPRLRLFQSTVQADPTPAVQDAFHRHRWPDRPELSVLMTRSDAATVSITTVEPREPKQIPGAGAFGLPRMTYDPIAG